MRAVTLQPAAGAHGELTGILMVRAYHESRGDMDRTDVLVPDSAHGTNPATATMAGLRTISIKAAPNGGTDLDAFRAALGPKTAAVMITNPSTMGLFESQIGELLEAVHAVGRAGVHGRREPERDPRAVQARRGGLRRHAHQHAQDVLDAAWRRRPRRRAGRGRREARAVPARAAGAARARRHVPPRASGGAPDVDRSDALVRREHRRPRARVCLSPDARRERPRRDHRRRGPRGELPQGPPRRLRRLRHPVPGRVQARVHRLGDVD